MATLAHEVEVQDFGRPIWQSPYALPVTLPNDLKWFQHISVYVNYCILCSVPVVSLWYGKHSVVPQWFAQDPCARSLQACFFFWSLHFRPWGIKLEDRIGTLMWNSAWHLECFLPRDVEELCCSLSTFWQLFALFGSALAKVIMLFRAWEQCCTRWTFVWDLRSLELKT